MKILSKLFIKAVIGSILCLKDHTNIENGKLEGPIVGKTSRRQVQNSGMRNGRDKIVVVAMCVWGDGGLDQRGRIC